MSCAVDGSASDISCTADGSRMHANSFKGQHGDASPYEWRSNSCCEPRFSRMCCGTIRALHVKNRPCRPGNWGGHQELGHLLVVDEGLLERVCLELEPEQHEQHGLANEARFGQGCKPQAVRRSFVLRGFALQERPVGLKQGLECHGVLQRWTWRVLRRAVSWHANAVIR